MSDFDPGDEIAREFARAAGEARINGALERERATIDLMEASEHYSFDLLNDGDVVTIETEADERLSFVVEPMRNQKSNEPRLQLAATVVETNMDILAPGERFRVDGIHAGGTVRPGMFGRFCAMSWSKFKGEEVTFESLRAEATKMSDAEIQHTLEEWRAEGRLIKRNGAEYILFLAGFARTAPILRAHRVSADGEESLIF